VRLGPTLLPLTTHAAVCAAFRGERAGPYGMRLGLALGKLRAAALPSQQKTFYAVRASLVPGTPDSCPVCGEKVGETGGLN